MEANVESMQNLYDNMSEYGYDLTRIPFVIQYNKRDLPNAAPIKDLQASLNPGWPIEEAARQKQTPIRPIRARAWSTGSAASGSVMHPTTRPWQSAAMAYSTHSKQ